MLKGTQLLLVHTVEPHRPTKDVDLLGLGSDDSDDIAQVFRDVCTVSVHTRRAGEREAVTSAFIDLAWNRKDHVARRECLLRSL